MRRRFFNLLTAISLILCLASFVLLVRGFWVCELFVASRFSIGDDEIVSRTVYLSSEWRQFCFTYRFQHDPILAQDKAKLQKLLPRWSFGHGADPASPLNTWWQGDTVWERLGFEYSNSNDEIQPNRNLFLSLGCAGPLRR